MISEARVDNGQRDSLLLDVGVRCPELPYQVSTAYLAPDEIVRMIHHVHLVGLSVPHAKLDLARNRRTVCRSHCALR